MPARLKRGRRNYLRRLRQPLLIPDVMTVRTLSEVRLLLERLPKAYRERPHWREVARDLEAAAGGADPDGVATALMVAFAVEGIACRPAKS